MGRMWPGVAITREVFRLELKALKRLGFIHPGDICAQDLSWNPGGGGATLWVNLADPFPYIRIRYTITNHSDGSKKSMDYRIDLAEEPSNLGRGSVLYFVCPYTGLRCRVLYMAYGSDTFISRQAYAMKGLRIYYQTQVSSKLNLYNDKYWVLDEEINRLSRMRATYLYKGKPTRRHLREEELRRKRERADLLRWTILPKSLRAMGVNP